MMMFQYVPLLAAISASLLSPSLCQDSDKTFVGSESYALYPPWLGLSSNEGTLSFTIRTSELSSLLLYAEGNGNIPSEGSTDYLVVTMDNGVIKILLQFFEVQSNGAGVNMTTISLGEHLNDNRPHTLLIRHSGQTLDYSLDSIVQASVTYSSAVVSNIGANGIYFGGLPNTVTPVLDSVRSEANFAGCLESIMASNNSQQVAPVMLLDQNNLRDGCIDPCNAVSCQAGECIARWPDRAFCDCSATSMSGESCSEDPSMINLAVDTYFCYKLKPQPFIGNVNTINVQLIGPLPPSGTIMTGLSENGDKFSLYLENSNLIYELANDNETVLSISSQELRLNSSYQISLICQSDHIELSVNSTSGADSIERFNGSLSGDLSMESVIFESICVGGGLLEVPNYVGTQSNVFFNYFALSEERNFNELDQTRILRTNHVYIQPSESGESPSLQFEKHTLANKRISFEFRTPTDASASVLLFSTNAQFQLLVTTFNGNLLVTSSVVGDSSRTSVQFCGQLPSLLNNGEWHHIEIQRTETGLNFTIDRSKMCSISGFDIPERLTSLAANASLEFGATTDNVMSFGSNVPFNGCFQNIEFTKENNSEPFRPNLEVVINSEKSFSAVGCFNCTSSHEDVAGCSDECDCTCIFTETNQPSCLCPGDVNSCPKTTPSQATHTTTSVTTSISPPPPATVNPLSAGVIVGIVLGVILGTLLIIAVILLLIFSLYHGLASRQGFYETHETNGKDLSMIRYSASLKELSSEVVNAESNGTIGSSKINRHDKEFYL